MGGLLKWILMIILVIMLGAWILTVSKTCNQTKDPLLDNTIPKDVSDKVGDAVDGAKANLDDLYEDGAEAMSDLEKEAMKAKDRLATTAENAGDRVFGEGEENDKMDEDDLSADERATRNAIAGRKGDGSSGSVGSGSSGSSSRSGASNDGGGKYFVVAGTYLEKSNADIMLRKLKKAGYTDAEIVTFQLSQYYTVFADRRYRLNDAKALAGRVSNKMGIEAYVHEKRTKRNR